MYGIWYGEGPTAQELCESRGGRPGLPVPIYPYGLCGRKATLKDRKVDVAVLGSPSRISLMVSVDGKHHESGRRSEGPQGPGEMKSRKWSWALIAGWFVRVLTCSSTVAFRTLSL